MAASNPELTIHLGDIYYVGLGTEVQENCPGLNTGGSQGVTWTKGSKGSLALNGNHEMYSGGSSYFESFIPLSRNTRVSGSEAAHELLCLETPVWRILAIDTGYNSDTLPGNCKLEQTLLDWLYNTINPVANRKPTVLLSHHQWFSGFGDSSYNTPAKQIAPYPPRQEFIWLWGHEHRLGIYQKYTSTDPAIATYARCIGHGGMSNELPGGSYPNQQTPQQVEFRDGDPARVWTLDDGTKVTPNGDVEMTINGPLPALQYFDADGKPVLREKFAPGPAGGGAWDGTLVRTIDPADDPHILYR